MQDSDLEALLVNWGNWVRAPRTLGAPAKATAASLESGYSNPQGKGCPTGWGDYTVPLTRLPFNLPDALKVESLISRLLPRSRTFLTFHYVYRADPRATCRKVRIDPLEYDYMLVGCKAELTWLLTPQRVHA